MTRARATTPGDGPSAAIPREDEFGDGEFLERDDLTALGMHLVQKYDHLNFIADYRIRFLWKREGGTANGRMTLGRCTLTNQMLRHFAEADWVIWLAANYCGEFEFGDYQVEALLFHELLHCRLGGREEDTPGIRGHSHELFLGEVATYGRWNDGLEALARVLGRSVGL